MMSKLACLFFAVSSGITGAQELMIRGGSSRDLQPAGWYKLDNSPGQHAQNVQDLGGGRIQITVQPGQEAAKLESNQYFTNGRFQVKVKSAAVMPGIITAVYLASGEGRTGDDAMGSQDELDFEFKGNDPFNVQTNVFVDGKEDLQNIAVGGDSSQTEHSYAVEWDNNHVAFFINGAQVRNNALTRPLKPMKLFISVWTTTNGWDGLIKWAGPTDWNTRGGQPATATFEVVQLPD